MNRLTYKLTPEQLVDVYRLHYRKGWGPRLFGVGVIATIVAFASAPVWGGSRTLITAIFVGLLAGGLFYWLQTKEWVFSRRYLKNLDLDRDQRLLAYEVNWNEAGFQSRSSKGSVSFEWDEFERWKADDDYILLYSNSVMFRFLAFLSEAEKLQRPKVIERLEAAGVKGVQA